jgi:hypothetical protein
MVGVTLSPDQIKSAQPEVRNWLQHEIAASLGPDVGPRFSNGPQRLGVCTPREEEAIYGSVRSMFPVVNVFFELGREGASIGQEGVEAYRLVDMLASPYAPSRHAAARRLLANDRTDIPRDS